MILYAEFYQWEAIFCKRIIKNCSFVETQISSFLVIVCNHINILACAKKWIKNVSEIVVTDNINILLDRMLEELFRRQQQVRKSVKDRLGTIG